MVSANKPVTNSVQRKRVLRQVSKLREEIADLMDYLDLLESRANDIGKPRCSTAEVRQKLGLD